MHSFNTLLTGKDDREVVTRESCDGIKELKQVLTVHWLIKIFISILLNVLIFNPSHYVNPSPKSAAALKG